MKLLELPPGIGIGRRRHRACSHDLAIVNYDEASEVLLVMDAGVCAEDDYCPSTIDEMNGVLLVLGDGRYPLTKELGHGAFGEVFEGRDTHLDMPVAVKLFREGVTFDAIFAEARVQARLSDNPHVIAVRNVIVEPPRPYVVMDLCPAGSVRDRLKAGTVTLVDAIRWTRGALLGLAHAHALGVIHRDVKPANWLLLDNGARAAISDFGLAEDTVRRILVDPDIYVPHQAPEVPVEGTSEASDIWAAGCTLYRLLTGKYPFKDEYEAAAGSFLAPHRLNLQVPMSVSRVIEQGLKVRPGDRYPDAVSMLSALNGCRVTTSWTKVEDLDTIETWTASAPGADYRIELVLRPKVGLELTARKDVRSGAGFMRARQDRPPTLARARQVLHRWLVDVVEGQRL